MKKSIFYFTALLFTINSFSQDLPTCEKIASTVYEAVGLKSSKTIEKYLDSDFEMAGQSGVIAKMILPQFLEQLNDKVLTYQKIKQGKGAFLKLVYKVKYKGLGEKESYILFTKNNTIKEISLVDTKVQVKK